MYSFLEQGKMLKIALQMLDEKGLLAHSALGGGTALAGSYWDHRYSTDIDIFIYTNEVGGIELLTQDKWSTKTKADMKSIGYTGDKKFNYAYLEFSIAEQCKIQFFDVSGFTAEPTVVRSLWGNININIESVEEIIAKKIHYRCDKANSRDIFDIALALYKDPTIFAKMGRVKDSSFRELHATLTEIQNSKKLLENYTYEIDEIFPSAHCRDLAYCSVKYLSNFLEVYIGFLDIGNKLSPFESKTISDISYKNSLEK